MLYTHIQRTPFYFGKVSNIDEHDLISAVEGRAMEAYFSLLIIRIGIIPSFV